MKRVIVSTSTSCLDYLGKPDNVRMLPMRIHLNGIDYLDGQTISIPDLVIAMRNSPNVTPTSSAPTDEELINYFYQLVKEGITDVLVVCLSAKVSPCYQHLVNIQDFFANRIRIHIYDSRIVSHGEAVMVYEASRMLDNGQPINAIIERLDEIRDNTIAMLTTDDLRNMIRSKRISAPNGFFANLLKMKPLLSVEADGRIIPIEMVRHFDNTIERMATLMVEKVDHHPAKYYILCYKNNPYAARLQSLLIDKGVTDITISPIASVSLANLGINGIGLMAILQY